MKTPLQEFAAIVARLAISDDDGFQRVGAICERFLAGDGTLDENAKLEFGFESNADRHRERLDSRNRTLTAAADLLPPGPPRAHARLLLEYANTAIPSGAAPEVRAAVVALRNTPLQPNQLTEILRRDAR